MENQNKLMGVCNSDGELRNGDGSVLEGLVAIGAPVFVRLQDGQKLDKEVQIYAPENAVAYVVGGDKIPGGGIHAGTCPQPVYGIRTTTEVKEFNRASPKNPKFKLVGVDTFPVQFYGQRHK